MSLKTLATHSQRYRDLRETLYTKIGEEWTRGATMAQIAEAVGLSRQRVHQILVEMMAEGKVKGREVKEAK